jgi:hypothetical protein
MKSSRARLSFLTTAIFIVLAFLVTSCKDGGPGGDSAAGPSYPKARLEPWQLSHLGQEGHGGDAIVCFSIPIERAIYQVQLSSESECVTGSPCSETRSSSSSSSSGARSGPVWRMTVEGRKNIQSAKPLEQHLGERIAGHKVILDFLNNMPVKEGYKALLTSFTSLPATFDRISQIHQQLGWLTEDGIASEYGLLDVNDSGFVPENEIDTTHCRELQAVVRRDYQLWYDADIIKHFDNAGHVLIQLHEELYAWGKLQDQINSEIPQRGRPAHEMSTKTRGLILKLLDDNINYKIINENLRTLGFSTMYWENLFKVPTPVGLYMDSSSCFNEQDFLKNFIDHGGGPKEFQFNVESMFLSRYLKGERGEPVPQLRNNYPPALSNMIAFALGYSGPPDVFRNELLKLQAEFEKRESCYGSF